jgi:CheY-like chemotaxis protein
VLVVVFDDNLLSSASILNQLQSAGHEAIPAGTILEARQGVPRRPDAILINLAARSFEPPALIRQLLNEPAMHGAQVIGFCGHLDEPRKTKAREAGCHHVISNAQAHKQLVVTLKQLLYLT